jgi:hypothetical protein
MTENHDEVRDIGDIPEHEADELKEIVYKVLEHHLDAIVVGVYNDHKRPLKDTAFGPLLEEIPEPEREALTQKGFEAFLGDRNPTELGEVEQDQAINYARKYLLVALSVHYPWLMARRKRAP